MSKAINIRFVNVPLDYLDRETLEDHKPTCLDASTRLLVVGTSLGRVILTSPEGHVIRQKNLHNNIEVTSVSLNLTGDRIASTAFDGSIIVQEVFEGTQESTELTEPLLCSAWRPLNDHFEIAVGTTQGHVFLIKKQWWISGLTSRLIFEDDLRQEAVSSLAWNETGDRLCFTTNSAAYVYDPSNNVKLLVAYHSKNLPAHCPPLIHWFSNQQMLLARGKRLDWCVVGPNHLDQDPQFVNGEICILSQLESHCLCCVKDPENVPKLVVFDQNGEVLFEETLSMLGTEFNSGQFRYCHCGYEDGAEEWYYIMTPDKILLCVNERDFSVGQVVSF